MVNDLNLHSSKGKMYVHLYVNEKFRLIQYWSLANQGYNRSYKNLQVGFQMNIINLTDFNMKLIMSAGITLLDNDKSMSF